MRLFFLVYIKRKPRLVREFDKKLIKVEFLPKGDE